MDWTSLVLDWMITYGAPVVCGVLFLGALGVPLPGTLVVIAAGAFIRQEILTMYSTPFLGIIGVVVGDTLVFGVGRFAHQWIEKRFGKMAGWKKAQESFEQRGGIAIYLTRWLLTPLAVPTNLIAGSSGYAFSKFFVFDLTGELTWIAIYGGLGYGFGSQWELITEFIANFSGLIMGCLAVGVGIYLLLRYGHKPEREVVI